MQNNKTTAKPPELKKPISRPVPKPEPVKAEAPNRPQPPQPQPQRQQPQQATPTAFHNPYNFVPAPPRQEADAKFGNHAPNGHSCYLDGYWSGRITVKLKTITPLLTIDAAKVIESGEHKTYPLRQVGGKPYLAPTSIKGMLRSAYEAVTNSRMNVLESHDSLLAYRMTPDPTIQAARVEKNDRGNLVFRLMGQVKLWAYEFCEKNEKLGLDKGAKVVAEAQKYPNKMLPRHGAMIWVKAEKSENTFGEEVYQFSITPPQGKGWKQGWACITGANCHEKTYERVFIERRDVDEIPVQASHEKLWKQLIVNYQDIHKQKIDERHKNEQKATDYLGHEPGQTAWSRHVYEKDALDLKDGTLCYIKFDQQQNIQAIFPVMISRGLYSQNPIALLPESLHPATAWDELSPADRVFGWVNQAGHGSYKGQIRIHNVECTEKSDTALTTFDSPIALNILGQPKPQQFRFYGSADKQGTPIRKGPKEKGYSQIEQGLRGRKVYPHHRLDYWDDEFTGVKEYLKTGTEKEKHTNQNRSITSWVKPTVEFTFDIDLVNLSDVELGALLYLLALPENHYHRLGGGKPLGFGSVKLTIDRSDLRTGQGWRDYYRSLVADQTVDQAAAIATKETFLQAVRDTYGKDGQLPEFIEAFERSAQGFDDDLPICYPRLDKQPNSNGEGFAWFVANEAKGGDQRSLPALVDDKGLPWVPKK